MPLMMVFNLFKRCKITKNLRLGEFIAAIYFTEPHFFTIFAQNYK